MQYPYSSVVYNHWSGMVEWNYTNLREMAEVLT